MKIFLEGVVFHFRSFIFLHFSFKDIAFCDLILSGSPKHKKNKKNIVCRSEKRLKKVKCWRTFRLQESK